MSDEYTSELLSLSTGRTGLLIGMPADATQADVVFVRQEVAAKFPGVTVAVITGCTFAAAFTYDPEEEAS